MNGGSDPRTTPFAAPLVSVRGLTKVFPVRRRFLGFGRRESVHAVDGINFDVAAGETLSLVGESGCGKSTTARVVLRLIEPTAGSIVFDGRELTGLSGEEMRGARRDMQIVFQDPYGSLDPRKSVGQLVGEPLLAHGVGTRASRRQRVAELLEKVGLPTAFAARYPHEFSGGQRQRLGIARALALNPRFIVCDEPVSALDVSIQAQVINLLQDLQEELGLTYLFISHDLSVVHHISTRVAVMYLGRIVELADRDGLYRQPLHPYSQVLLSSVAGTGTGRRFVPKGEVPNPIHPPSGCHFHPRCPFAEARCRTDVPALRRVAESRDVACHLVEAATGEDDRPHGPSIRDLPGEPVPVTAST